MTQKDSAKSRYDQRATERAEFLRVAYQCSRLTIPSLIPFESDTGSRHKDVKLEQPYQSLGAHGVRTLASKLLLTLLPPNTPFFRLQMGRAAREELTQLAGREADQFKAEIEAGLQIAESDVLADIESSQMRTRLFECLKHLTVAGNGLLFVDKKPRFYPLYKYTTKRDPSGNVLEIIVHEKVDKKTLPEDVREFFKAQGKIKDTEQHEDVDIYTVVQRAEGKWDSWQEAYDLEVPGTRGTYPLDENPWIPLRMIAIDGEDYGRGIVEENYGDLQSSEDLSQSIVQGSQIMARLLWFVNPNGFTDIDDIQESENGDIVPGRPEDVGALQAEKYGDFRVAMETLVKIEERLSRAFLMTSSVRRDAERVTAEEIRVMTAEIEDTLGGIYSVLAEELQLPFVKRWMADMEKRGDLPRLPKDAIEPIIVTGVEALGRGQDLRRLRGFIADVVELAQAKPSLLQRLKDDAIMTRLSNGHGIDTAGLLKTEEELAMEQQQMMAEQAAADIATKAVPEVVKATAQQQTQ